MEFFSTALLKVSSWKTAYLQWACASFKKIFLDDQIIVLTRLRPNWNMCKKSKIRPRGVCAEEGVAYEASALNYARPGHRSVSLGALPLHKEH